MQIVIGARLQAFTTTGSMGRVTDVHYIRCYWPQLDEPVALFAPGSNQIIVEGPPIPRNVIFPGGTVFRDYAPDAQSAGMAAFETAFPDRRPINLSPDETAVFMAAYEAAEAALPAHATRIATQGECFFIRHVEAAERYITMLTPAEAGRVANGLETAASMKAAKQLWRQGDSNGDNPNTPKFRVVGGVIVPAASDIATEDR
jgi:hypothetical protein